MATEKITFSFGKNWSDLVEGLDESDIARARTDIEHWLGEQSVQGKRILDVGSGSGIHSLSFFLLGAREVHSFDFDPLSVSATRKLREQAGNPVNWTVEQGFIPDREYLRTFEKFDVVYSWGVLHHTGSMWQAVGNCLELVAPGGLLWISLYVKGPRFKSDLALKRKFNAASRIGKRWMIAKRILRAMAARARHGKNPLAWNEKRDRGMNVYHDIVDWLGGLPYETATEDEVLRFARQRGFVLERINASPEGGCSVYLFSRQNLAGGGLDEHQASTRRLAAPNSCRIIMRLVLISDPEEDECRRSRENVPGRVSRVCVFRGL